MMCQGLGRWRRRVNAAGPSATAAAPRWWRSRCGRHSGRRGDRNAEGVDCVWSRLQRKWLWTELRASFDGTGRVSLSIQPINIPTNPKPARLSATLENSKWRCSPVKPSLPVSLRPTPPKLFEKSQPGPGNPCLHSGDHTSPPHLPVRRRHGSGLPHLRGRLRGQRPPLPRRLLARAASASSRSQVRSSPSSRRTAELHALRRCNLIDLTLRYGAHLHNAATSSPVTRAPPPTPARQRGRAFPTRQGAAAPSIPSACSPSSPPSAASTLR